ncbi:hypothetical protein C1H71_10305 [Iodobacter fluviatilis]|uniref:Uncharacterized protein n=1 Tax=Iodobacter fluviatilis TaxID=537 RepID=A0A7G3G9C9_9NEIS|nr:hypothetical protein C1H71_10305 [Iodobacter fluviatilis]
MFLYTAFAVKAAPTKNMMDGGEITSRWTDQTKPLSPSAFIGDPAAQQDSRQRHAGMTMFRSGKLI